MWSSTTLALYFQQLRVFLSLRPQSADRDEMEAHEDRNEIGGEQGQWVVVDDVRCILRQSVEHPLRRHDAKHYSNREVRKSYGVGARQFPARIGRTRGQGSAARPITLARPITRTPP